MQLHHVQLAIPEGGEDTARRFWVDVLGFVEVAKPTTLAARGGFWCRHHEVEIHLGVEQSFRPARKAHPGLLVADLESIRRRLEESGFTTTSDDLLPGYRRFYVSDPFGNRLEFLEPDG